MFCVYLRLDVVELLLVGLGCLLVGLGFVLGWFRFVVLGLGVRCSLIYRFIGGSWGFVV